MKKLLIKETQKQYNSMLNAYDVATERKLNVHCFHISIVLEYGLNKDQFVDHITDAIKGLNLTNNPILNDSAITRFKSLNTNKKLLEMFVKSKPKDLSLESVKKFLKSFNIDSQELLQIACYDGGIFSRNVLNEDTKKVQEIKKKSKKPSGETNQTKDKSNIEINVKEIEKSILKIAKFHQELASKQETRSYLRVSKDFTDAIYNKDNELYDILVNKFKKNGIKAS